MALDTYDNLKTEIADWLDRDDLTDRIDTFIDLAEANHVSDIRIEALQVHNTAFAIADGARTVAMPSDYGSLRSLRIKIPSVTSGRRYYPDLDFVTPDELADRSINDEFRPTAYTVFASTIEFDTEPDQAYTGELLYYKKATALSASNASNEVLANVPGAYLFGALVESAPYLGDDPRIATWRDKYDEVVGKANNAAIQNRHPGRVATTVQNMPRRDYAGSSVR